MPGKEILHFFSCYLLNIFIKGGVLTAIPIKGGYSTTPFLLLIYSANGLLNKNRRPILIACG
jgi:hypothetical protein